MSTAFLTKERTIPSHERSFPPVQQDGLRLGWMGSNRNTNNDPTNSRGLYLEGRDYVSSSSEYTDSDISFFLNCLSENVAKMAYIVESTIYFEGRAPGMLATMSAISMMTLVLIG